MKSWREIEAKRKRRESEQGFKALERLKKSLERMPTAEDIAKADVLAEEGRRRGLVVTREMILYAAFGKPLAPKEVQRRLTEMD